MKNQEILNEFKHAFDGMDETGLISNFIEQSLKQVEERVRKEQLKEKNEIVKEWVAKFDTEIERVVLGMAGEVIIARKGQVDIEDYEYANGSNDRRQQGLDWARDNLGINIK